MAQEEERMVQTQSPLFHVSLGKNPEQKPLMAEKVLQMMQCMNVCEWANGKTVLLSDFTRHQDRKITS